MEFEKFDKDIFEATIKFAIIGEKTKDLLNPYIIRFILKNGSSNYIKENVDILNLSTIDVLEFESKQKYTVFEQTGYHSYRKQIRDRISVRVELEN